jgi:hypothetical protein
LLFSAHVHFTSLKWKPNLFLLFDVFYIVNQKQLSYSCCLSFTYFYFCAWICCVLFDVVVIVFSLKWPNKNIHFWLYNLFLWMSSIEFWEMSVFSDVDRVWKSQNRKWNNIWYTGIIPVKLENKLGCFLLGRKILTNDRCCVRHSWHFNW